MLDDAINSWHGWSRYQLAQEREKTNKMANAFNVMATSFASVGLGEVETPGDYGIGDPHGDDNLDCLSQGSNMSDRTVHEHEKVGGGSTPRPSDSDRDQRHRPGDYGTSP